MLGLTSLLTDAGSELIFPLLPLFLADSLHASPLFLGLIEGAADLTASVVKLVSGVASDRLARKKPLVLAGYGLASAVRPLVALATSPWHVLTVRLLDRVGKGVRSSPRDALLADAAPPGEAGRAFGFHRAMDHAGAVVGPLLATAMVGLGLQLRTIFWLAAIPGALATAMVLAVRERPRASEAGPGPSAGAARPLEAPLPPRAAGLSPSLRGYLGILALFALGNSSDAFLLYRAHDLGVGPAAIPLLWMVLHVSKMVSSYAGGRAADRVPRRWLIAAGWLLYAAVYLAFAVATRAWHAWALFVVYGVYHGVTEPAEKALVKDLAPAAARGKAYGWYNFVVGASALPAGLLTGALWREAGPAAALGTGAGLALLAAACLGGSRIGAPGTRQS